MQSEKGRYRFLKLSSSVLDHNTYYPNSDTFKSEKGAVKKCYVF